MLIIILKYTTKCKKNDVIVNLISQFGLFCVNKKIGPQTREICMSTIHNTYPLDNHLQHNGAYSCLFQEKSVLKIYLCWTIIWSSSLKNSNNFWRFHTCDQSILCCIYLIFSIEYLKYSHYGKNNNPMRFQICYYLDHSKSLYNVYINLNIILCMINIFKFYVSIMS